MPFKQPFLAFLSSTLIIQTATDSIYSTCRSLGADHFCIVLLSDKLDLSLCRLSAVSVVSAFKSDDVL